MTMEPAEVAQVFGRLLGTVLTVMVRRKRRDKRATRAFRSILRGMLGAHDWAMQVARHPHLVKRLVAAKALLDELGYRQLNMFDFGVLEAWYIEDRLHEDGFARRIFDIKKFV